MISAHNFFYKSDLDACDSSATRFPYHGKDLFNQSLENVVLPSGLQVLIFGNKFNQSLHNVKGWGECSTLLAYYWCPSS